MDYRKDPCSLRSFISQKHMDLEDMLVAPHRYVVVGDAKPPSRKAVEREMQANFDAKYGDSYDATRREFMRVWLEETNGFLPTAITIGQESLWRRTQLESAWDAWEAAGRPLDPPEEL